MTPLRRSSWAAAALIISFALLPAVSGAADGLVPLHVEKLQPLFSHDATGNTARLDFTAFGRGFRLALAPNPRLAAVAAGSSGRFYAGSIDRIRGSWARISVRDGTPRGLVWDGVELFVVDSGRGGAEPPGTVIFRLSEAVLEEGVSFAGDMVKAPRDAAASYRALIADLSVATQALQSGVATQRLEVSVLGDAAYVARYGNEAEARDEILTRLNNVDGIFSAQVGVQLRVVTVNLADALVGQLSGTTDSSALLDELGMLRQQTAALYATGLTHLFTGRGLNGNTAGIAYVTALCSRRFGASLAQAHNSAALDALITAHEIGHVFGAPHDGSGQCAATPQSQYIMTPTVNTAITSFSQCSLDEMRPVIASSACLVTLAVADLSLPASLGSQSVATGSDFAWQVSIVNHGGRAASGAHATLQVTPALTVSAASTAGGSCVIQAGLVTCDLPVIEAAATQVVQLALRSPTAGTFALDAQVVAADDSDTTNNSSAGTLTVSADAAAPAPAPAPAPGQGGNDGGGGGGALDAVSILLLLLLLVVPTVGARRRIAGRRRRH